MSVNVKFNNPNSIFNRIFSKDIKLYANSTWQKLIDPYVPFRYGNLSQNIDITQDYIHYKSPYAKRMYYGEGFHFNKDRHPLATAKWDKVASFSQKDKLIESIESYFKRGNGNGK